LVANFPFILTINFIGFDAFIDSFENPSSYLCLDNPEKTINYNLSKGQFLIFQKSSHPDFNIEQKDIILYCKENGELSCQKVYGINSIGSIKYYTTNTDQDFYNNKPVYEDQILGKIISVIDGNIINQISMDIWDVSIHNFNINSFL
jgi:hypothetical protein